MLLSCLVSCLGLASCNSDSDDNCTGSASAVMESGIIHIRQLRAKPGEAEQEQNKKSTTLNVRGSSGQAQCWETGLGDRETIGQGKRSRHPQLGGEQCFRSVRGFVWDSSCGDPMVVGPGTWRQSGRTGELKNCLVVWA